jgi:aryl-alcohol dehydrogenase-like predicted oxidoreductase
VLGAVQKVKPVADELGLTMAQLAIAWVLQNDNVAAAIVGAARPEQVQANVEAAGVQIPAEALQRIDVALADVIQSDPGQTAESAPATRPA